LRGGVCRQRRRLEAPVDEQILRGCRGGEDRAKSERNGNLVVHGFGLQCDGGFMGRLTMPLTRAPPPSRNTQQKRHCRVECCGLVRPLFAVHVSVSPVMRPTFPGHTMTLKSLRATGMMSPQHSVPHNGDSDE